MQDYRIIRNRRFITAWKQGVLACRQKKPPSAKGKGRKGVQILDSSELSHYEEVYETIGDKLLSFDLVAQC